MESTAIDTLLTSGRQLAVLIESNISGTDEVSVTWVEALFQRQFKRWQQVLRQRTRECLDYELAASDLLRSVPQHPEAGSAAIPLVPFMGADALGVYAQRDTLRMLLGTLNAGVADIKERCESRVTNAINSLILILTISSIGIAVVTYKYAVSSGETQEKSMKKQIAALDKSSSTLEAVEQETIKQQKLLAKIGDSTSSQASYLASEQLIERKQRETDVLRAYAARMHEAADVLTAYYSDIDKMLQNTKVLYDLQDAVWQIPSMQLEGTREEIEKRLEMAKSVSELSEYVKDSGELEGPQVGGLTDRLVVDLSTARPFGDSSEYLKEIRLVMPSLQSHGRSSGNKKFWLVKWGDMMCRKPTL